MVDFDGKAREWDTNPAFVERGRQVAEAIRALVRLYPGVRAVDGLSVVVRRPAAHWPAGVPLPAGGEERTGQIGLSCDKVPPLLACLERGTRLEPGHAAPLSPLELLSAQVLSRLMVVLGAELIVYRGASLSLGFPMHGSYTALALLVAAAWMFRWE